jgi:hypothetical protein
LLSIYHAGGGARRVNGAQRAPRRAKPISAKQRIKSNRHTQPSEADILVVSLNRLKKSPRNTPKIPHTKFDIAQLAASIAADGLLQDLVIEAGQGPKGRPTGDYLVTAGEGGGFVRGRKHQSEVLAPQ